MKKHTRRIQSILWGSLACFGFALLPLMPATADMKPQTITFEQDTLYPEGIDYDPGCDCFYVSSLGKGQIGRVFKDGRYRVFSQDVDLISTVGILVDTKRQRLYAAISDTERSERSTPSNQNRIAKLGIFNLTNGQKIKTVDLGILKPGIHLANDLAQDDQGNVYITDSRSRNIFKVTPEGEPSIFLTHFALQPSNSKAFGMNGIVYHPDGYLLSFKSETGELLKIPLNNPTSLTRVQIQDKLGKYLDGMEWTHDGKLAVVANMDGAIFLLDSTDNWQTASVADATQLSQTMPTAITRKGNQLFALHSKMNQPLVQDFMIEEVLFESWDGE